MIFGGVGQKPQTEALERGIDILIATPGRLLDLIGQGFIHLDTLEYFVLDEADRMLDMGFIHDIKRILPLLPKKRQSLFFSATMPPEIERLAGTILIHGNKSQTARQRALTNFKDHTTRVLIATDIAARGIDVDHLTHVINYELPNVPETYVHRIGRTGRAGREGVAFSFCDAEEVPLLKDIQKLIGKEVPIAGGHMYETKEVKAAVAEKKEAIKQESKRRNMFGSKRDGSYWRNKKRAANSSK